MAGIARPDNVGIEMINYEIISYYSYNHYMYNTRVPHTLFNGTINNTWPNEGWDFNYDGDNMVIDINERCNLYVYIDEYLQCSPLQIEPQTYEEQLIIEPKVGWHLFVKDMQPGRYTFSHKSGYNGTAEWYFEKIEEDIPDIPDPPVIPPVRVYEIRLNSNIYKNIFPDVITDMEYMNDLIDNTPTTLRDIVQVNHQLELYDVVYLDDNGDYRKAIAENSEKAIIAGVVTKISSNNVFTLMYTGKFDYPQWNYNDTSVMYLSDKYPGKIVHYSEISNMVYVPVAVYTNNSMIINIQQGSAGAPLEPYTDEESDFDLYTKDELDDTINQILNEV